MGHVMRGVVSLGILGAAGAIAWLLVHRYGASDAVFPVLVLAVVAVIGARALAGDDDTYVPDPEGDVVTAVVQGDLSAEQGAQLLAALRADTRTTEPTA